MFFFRRLPSAPDEIYSSCLASLHEGHALWYPEPHESGEPQIGDVGFIHRGAFIRLFNLDASAPEKKVVFWDPPFEITEPLPPGVLKIDRRRRPLVPAHYRSHGVESRQVYASADIAAGPGVSATLSAQYTCKASQGAVLALKSEAYAEAIFENLVLKKYITRHHDRWYAYVKGVLGQDIKRGNIVVVCGWVKTEADWATVAFSKAGSSSNVSVEGNAGGVAGVGMGTSHASYMTGPTMQRQGEIYFTNAPGAVPAVPNRDQCVLVKRYKVRKRLGVLKEVVAGAGYHRLPDGGDEGDVPDALDVLLDYILEVSNVETAIASDDDVWSIVDGRSVADFASYLRQVQPPVKIDGTLGSLCMEDMVVQEREQAFARRTITTADLAEWPDARLDGGGRMEDTRVFIGSSTIESQPLRTKRLVFTDPQDPSLACAHSAVSADGKLLAASFGSNDVLVWRLSDGLLVQRLGHDHGHTDRIFALAFSPVDPCTLVSGSKDTTALVWDTRRARVLQRLEGHRGPVSSIAYAPDGALIATGSHGDTSVKLWAPALGACLHTFDVGAGMYTLAFSADNTRLAVALGRSGLLYDLRTHARVATLQHASTEVLYWALDSAAGADADARVATAPGLQNPGEVKLWSAHTGAPLRTIAHPPHGLSMPVAFAPDGSEVLAACNAECTALAFDARTGALRRTFRAAKRVYRVAYSPDGAYVAFGAADGDVEVHDAASGVFLGRFDGREGSRELWEVQFLADGQSLLARFKYGPLLLYNVQDVLRIR